MGKQRAAPGGLPGQGGPQGLSGYGQNDKIILASEMAAGGFGRLIGGRKVDIAVSAIDR